MTDRAGRLGMLAGFGYRGFIRELRAALCRQGYDDLGGAYEAVFRALCDEPLPLVHLAARLGMTAQGAAKIVDEMEARAYVERRPDPADGRIKQLHLGKRGRAAFNAGRRFSAAYEKRLAARLGEADLKAARRVLEAMAAAGANESGGERLPRL